MKKGINMSHVEMQYWEPQNITVETENGFRYRDTKSTVLKEETWVGTKEEIFKKFDKLNNSLRYCNGSYWRFKDQKFQHEFDQWYKSLEEMVRFDMYYGNGVVD